MMIKANGEYLDFNGDVEIESQIKLFEEISTSNGDFSYDIDIQDNGQNRKTLGIPRADTVKTIYQNVPSEIIDDTGQSIYTGNLQVNRIEGGIISTTFYSGNAAWFSLLTEPLASLPLYKYDVDLTEANIQASWLNDSGLVFPLLDAGALVSRGYNNLMPEDFTPGFYVKTLFNEIFYPQGIKVEGDLIDDPNFKKLLLLCNNKNQGDSLTDRSCYVNKNTNQLNLTSLTKITFEDDVNFPFFDGAQNNFVSSTYTPDIKMRIGLDLSILTTIYPDTQALLKIYKNGSLYKSYSVSTIGSPVAVNYTFTKHDDLIIEAGEEIEIYMDANLFGGGASVSVLDNSTIRITPNYSYGTYRVAGSDSVPGWTQGEFVSRILNLFNTLPSYNSKTKKLTLNLFDKIKEKEYVNISNEIVINSVDFSEFISNYGKNNYFKYDESDEEDLKQYNISNFISYGSGNIPCGNDYIDNDVDVIESDFTAPITYLNPIFDISMEKLKFIELEEVESKNITSVTNSSGVPRFNMSNANNLFTVGDLVRIKSGADYSFEYEGDYVVNAVTTTYITVNGLTFGSSVVGTATLMNHSYSTDDSVYLFINVADVENSFFTSNSTIYLGASTTFTSSSLAYFNLLSNNTAINKVYKQSMSFGSVNNPLAYQLTLLDTYWPLFSRVLNNSVMLKASGFLKRTTFDNMKSFLRPIRIDTEETTNLYYLNRNRGYKGSERECELELIKLN